MTYATRRAGLTTEERFWNKVDKTGDCWLWTAAIRDTGYGAFKANGNMAQAHRIAYELLVGPIPEGLQLDHLCRVRHCVNPAHLEPVVQRVNLLRGVGWAGRNARKKQCPQGHSYSTENTAVRNGKRYCRTCHRTRWLNR